MFVIGLCIVWLSLLILHELGHILAARLLGLKVYGVRVALRPVPHVFVLASYSYRTLTRVIFYAAGPFVSGLLFLALLLSPLRTPALIYAFVFTLIIESNPFFSDFTLLLTSHKMRDNLQKNPAKIWHRFAYSPLWYLWFSLWAGYIFLLCSWAQGRVDGA